MTRLDSVRLNVLNAQGEAIFGVQDFLHPEDPSQQLVVRVVDFSERSGLIRQLIGAFRGFLPVWEGPTAPLIYGYLQILNQDGKVALDLALDMETRNERTSAETGDLKWYVEEHSPGPLRTVSPELPPVEAYP